MGLVFYSGKCIELAVDGVCVHCRQLFEKDIDVDGPDVQTEFVLRLQGFRGLLSNCPAALAWWPDIIANLASALDAGLDSKEFPSNPLCDDDELPRGSKRCRAIDDDVVDAVHKRVAATSVAGPAELARVGGRIDSKTAAAFSRRKLCNYQAAM